MVNIKDKNFITFIIIEVAKITFIKNNSVDVNTVISNLCILTKTL